MVAVGFLKWAGSKRAMVDSLIAEIDDRRSPSGRYFEPFLGSGAVALAVDGAVSASDACGPLIDAWLMVRDRPRELATCLFEMADSHRRFGRSYYLMVRSSSPESATIEAAARFIYLNKAGFNGLYRVNKRGEFNVPCGSKNPSMPSEEQLVALSDRVEKWSIERRDFESAIDEAVEGDAVYADPPYDGTFDYSSGFGVEDRRRLAAALRRAARRGVGVVATDADTPLVRQLYSWAEMSSVAERRRVAASAARRGDAACVVAVRP